MAPEEEQIPLLNRFFGGRSKYRLTQLVRRRTREVQARRVESTEKCDRLNEVLRELEESSNTNRRQILLGIFFVFNHFVVGVISMMFLEGWSLHDAAYFCVVTLTTVGYGDLSPTTVWSKVFVMYYVIVSIGIVSSYVAYCVGLFIDRQEELLLADVVAQREYDNLMQANDYGSLIRLATKDLDFSDYTGMVFGVTFLGIVLCIGCIIFVVMEQLSFLDALYATIISATTVGFGDLHPVHPKTKFAMTVWLVFSTIAVAKVVGDFTEARVKSKQRAVTRRLLTAKMDEQSLRMLDEDCDGKVGWGEFLSAMMVSCGKIEQSELETFRMRFNELDLDKDGQLNVTGEADNS